MAKADGSWSSPPKQDRKDEETANLGCDTVTLDLIPRSKVVKFLRLSNYSNTFCEICRLWRAWMTGQKLPDVQV